MKKKGFTLIELLGVIVILAVIVLISVPIVTNIIENTKKNALKSSAYGILESANLYFTVNSKNIDDYLDFEIKNNVQTDNNDKLKYSGYVDEGYIRIVSNGKIALCIDNNKYYASKDLNTSEISVEEGTCTSEFMDDEFVTIGGSSYVGIRLNVKEYASQDALPKSTGEGYIGVITSTKITDYYLSHEGIENPKNGAIWIVQNSSATPNIKNKNSKIGVSCVLQYENGVWVPKDSYVFNDSTWVQLSRFADAKYLWEYDYTGSYQVFKAPYTGIYTIELWGAQGGSMNEKYPGGLGAYTKGDIYLEEGKEIYIYVGSQPTTVAGGYNGGGNGRANARGGGGSTDVRTIASDDWANSTSLRSRIMVAAGGAGSSLHDTGSWATIGGAGGGLEGKMGSGGSASLSYPSEPAKQGIGGISNVNYSGQNGSFGKGGNSYTGDYSSGGGGSGWYGGAGSAYAGGVTTGGSSYISGHKGCNAIKEDSLFSIGTSYSWTKYYFTNTKMIDGDGYTWTDVIGKLTEMPSKTSTGNVVGNNGNGYAKISLVSPMYKSREVIISDMIDNNTEFTYNYTGNYQEFEAPKDGTYKIELWGAQGGSVNSQYHGGFGAYTKGDIYLKKGTKLYIYVGYQPKTTAGGYNGGGNGRANARGGGGSTDVRTIASDDWANSTSLRSRIMVAAGGAGSSLHNNSDWATIGGAGGGLEGKMGLGGSASLSYPSQPAKQGIGGIVSASYSGQNGSFGKGGNSFTGDYSSGGGGSGWYGGAGSSYAGGITSGGSSYISGHKGCNAVKEDVLFSTGTSYSWTNYYFTNTKMIDGDGYEWTDTKENMIKMPSKNSTEKVIGNEGNGYAKITLISTEKKSDETLKNEVIANNTEFTYNYTGNYQEFEAPKNGTYTFELWGAQGGSLNTQYHGGFGAYTKGDIYLTKGTKLYIYVGGYPMSTAGGYNGGGNGRSNARGGGGATDVRTIVSEDWSNAMSLRSRIMVAAGGAGSSMHNNSDWATIGGAGGGLEGKIGSGGSSSLKFPSISAKQELGGISNLSYSGQNGSFGKGGNSYTGDYSSGGGGSGWYGGAGSAYAGGVTTGGSSYISGHDGCNSVNSNGIHTGSMNSWTNYIFTNTLMIDGDGYGWTNKKNGQINMPDKLSNNNVVGNSQSGYAKIYLKKEETKEENLKDQETSWKYSLSKNYQIFETPKDGTYKIELWGAQGGTMNSQYPGGLGAYTSGTIKLKKGTNLYIYVGEQPNSVAGGYNGGGNGRSNARGGGGATDIRIVNSDSWDNANSLRSRIMVAAGGSGASLNNTSDWAASGGAGGGLEGKFGFGGSSATNHKSVSAPNQLSGGIANKSYPGQNGSFGKGGNSYTGDWSSGGGGSGWYGSAGASYAGSVTAGGSSYISGHNGCIGINSDGTSKSSEALTMNDSYSWTSYFFNDTKMIDGDGFSWTNKIASSASYMPSIDGSQKITGNEGHGYAKITLLNS